MAVKATSTNNDAKAQIKLVKQSPEQRLKEQSDIILSVRIKEIERQKQLGIAKTILNEIKELKEKLDQNAQENATEDVRAQLKLQLDSLTEEGKGDLQGRVMDQSNVHTAEGLEGETDSEEEGE